jgi:hypothetical protein
MAEITRATSLQELAVIVSEALERAGIIATLSGGSAVSIYSDNRYQSHDLDFVTLAAPARLQPVVASLGFVQTESRRLYAHPQTEWLLEFPSGPLGFGQTIVDGSQLETLPTPWGSLRVITPTLCVMDRLAAFCHWGDRQCWEQLQAWAMQEGLSQQAWRASMLEEGGCPGSMRSTWRRRYWG